MLRKHYFIAFLKYIYVTPFAWGNIHDLRDLFRNDSISATNGTCAHKQRNIIRPCTVAEIFYIMFDVGHHGLKS